MCAYAGPFCVGVLGLGLTCAMREGRGVDRSGNRQVWEYRFRSYITQLENRSGDGQKKARMDRRLDRRAHEQKKG